MRKHAAKRRRPQKEEERGNQTNGFTSNPNQKRGVPQIEREAPSFS